MLVFRSVSVGLLLACFAMLVARPPVELRVTQAAQPAVERPEPPPTATIIDVAPGITAMQLAGTIHLAAGEQIIAVDDIAVTGNVGAGLLLASRDLRSRQFIDFSVAGPQGERRVLALLH